MKQYDNMLFTNCPDFDMNMSGVKVSGLISLPLQPQSRRLPLDCCDESEG